MKIERENNRKPHQVYRPANQNQYHSEIARIYRTCKRITVDGKPRYYDTDGNTYVIDGEDGTITIN